MTRVLIVDDDPDIVAALEMALGDAGYSYSTAPGGVDALQEIDQDGYDVILLDVRMPDVGGLDVLTLLRYVDKARKAGVVIISADAALSSTAMEQAGADVLLPKPFNLHDLFAAIDTAARGTPRHTSMEDTASRLQEETHDR